jgi:4-oxalmesaconate hydratase
MLTRRDWIIGSSALALASAGGALGQETPRTKQYVIDCHGHYTTEPSGLGEYRKAQIAALSDPTKSPPPASLKISDDQLRDSVQIQLRLQRERGTDVTIFSPRAAGMSHHIGTAVTSRDWTLVCNELIHRICGLFPQNSSASVNCRNRRACAPKTASRRWSAALNPTTSSAST